MKSLRQIFFYSIAIYAININADEIDKSYQEQSLLSVLYAQTSAEYSANNMQTYKNAKIALDKAIIDMNWSAALEQKNNLYPPSHRLILIVLGLLL